MAKLSVFYSWQDDIDRKLNRHFIHDCLVKAVRRLNRQEELNDLVVDRDTKNVPGMPDIGVTVLEKIDKAALVVADLSIINPKEVRRSDERPVSNPNVLFELGYAFGKLGPKRIIGVVSKAFGDAEDLPFDLRPKRLMTYRLTAGDDKTNARQELVDDLTEAIRLSLGESKVEQIKRNTEAKRWMAEIMLLGTEIDEWEGIENLPNVLKSHQLAAGIRSAKPSLPGAVAWPPDRA